MFSYLQRSRCIVSFPELELEIAPSQGVLTTVQGVIQKALDDLAADQPARLTADFDSFTKIQAIVTKLTEYLALEACPFTIVFNDPSGNSYVENPLAPNLDPNWYLVK
jgi:zinc finger protein